MPVREEEASGKRTVKPWPLLCRTVALCLSLLTFAAVFDSAPAAAQWYELGRGIAGGLFGGMSHHYSRSYRGRMPAATITIERGTLPSGTATMLPGTRIEAAGAAAVRR
jgi:uncharacterized membrane protein